MHRQGTCSCTLQKIEVLWWKTNIFSKLIPKCESCTESWISPSFFDWLLFILGLALKDLLAGTGIMVIDPYKCHGQVFEHWSNYNWVNSLFTRALMLIPYSCTPVRTWRKLWTSSTNWCRTSTSSSPWWGPWRSRGRSPWVTSKWPWPLFCLDEGVFGLFFVFCFFFCFLPY